MDFKRNTTTEIYELEENVTAELSRIFTEGTIDNVIRVGPQGYLLWGKYQENLQQLIDFELRPDDIILVGFPKSGTTWTEELVWLIANDFDYKTAISVPLYKRFSFFGYITNVLTKSFKKRNYQEDASKLKMAADHLWSDRLDRCAKMPSPRFLKAHLPFSLLPSNIVEKTKVVYVARDPRDVAVSFFHHMKLMQVIHMKVEFKEYWQLFMKNLIMYTPYFAHFREAWKMKDHPNMLFLFYEELSKDLAGVARRVAKFLGKTLTEEQIAGLCEHLGFDNFRQNKMVNYDHIIDEFKELGVVGKDVHFMRKGKVGGWREYFDEEMAKEAEQWMEEGLRGIDFRFEN